MAINNQWQWRKSALAAKAHQYRIRQRRQLIESGGSQ